MRNRQYCIVMVLLTVIIQTGRVWPQTKETNVNIYDSKVVEVNQPDGTRKYYWFEAKGDPLIRKYILKQIGLSEYVLTQMGSKSPNTPEVILSIEDNIPGKEIPCWNISAAQIIDDYLWISLIPIRQPRIAQYISMPPHPHGVRPGGNPYEGGIIRIELKTSKWTRWTSNNDLPTEMVCQEVEGLPEEIIFGNVITQIQKSKDKIIFKSRNDSEIQFEIKQEKFKCVHSGEPNTLIALIKDEKIYYQGVKSDAIRRLGELRSDEAIPVLVEILAGNPTTAGSDHRYEAMDALITINSLSVLDKLKILADSEDDRTSAYARAVINEIQTKFCEPVNGLRFKITTHSDPSLIDNSIGINISIMNITDKDIQFCYKDDWPLSFQLILNIQSEQGDIIVRNADPNATNQHLQNIKIKAGQVVRIYRMVEPLPPGRYKIKYYINVPVEYVEYAKSKYDASEVSIVWHGSVTTNDVTVNVLRRTD